MRKVLLSLFVAVFVLGLFAATGYAVYRLGYARGAQEVQGTTNDDTPRVRPELRPFDDFGPRGMRDFGFERSFGPGGFPRMGFGFFPLLIWLARITVLALIVLFIVWLFTRSGWRLTRRTVSTTSSNTETKTDNPENE